MALEKLLTPLKVGDLQLDHRIVLAPLTRQRANQDSLTPQPGLAEEYYAQRATKGGLLITEATVINSESLMSGVPGIWREDQVETWKRVVDKVHAKGGLICMQLWHIGRVAHDSFKDHPACEPGKEPTRGASAVTLPGKTRGTLTKEKLPNSTPRPYSVEELERLVQDYRRAAENAKRAGFDAVEIHSAHGYLLDQFLNDGTNKRQDRFGGSVENRARLLHKVVEAVGSVFGFGRTAVRISPHAEDTMKYYATTDSDPDGLYAHVIRSLSKYKLAYLLLTEPRWFGGANDGDHTTDPGWSMNTINPAKFRHLYTGGVLMGAGGFTPANAEQAVQDGDYDIIAFGRWFISNPDFVYRLQHGLPLNRYNRKTFYASGPGGYIDYPTFDAVQDKSTLVPQNQIGKSLASAKL